MNSRLKETIINYDLRYIDWESGPEFPKVLNENDFDSLKTSLGLFARKFSISHQENVIYDWSSI